MVPLICEKSKLDTVPRYSHFSTFSFSSYPGFGAAVHVQDVYYKSPSTYKAVNVVADEPLDKEDAYPVIKERENEQTGDGAGPSQIVPTVKLLPQSEPVEIPDAVLEAFRHPIKVKNYTRGKPSNGKVAGGAGIKTEENVKSEGRRSCSPPTKIPKLEFVPPAADTQASLPKLHQAADEAMAESSVKEEDGTKEPKKELEKNVELPENSKFNVA